jgi:hypothetical protein
MEIIEKIRKLKIDPYPEKSFRDIEISLFLNLMFVFLLFLLFMEKRQF